MRTVSKILFSLIASLALVENSLTLLVFLRHKNWLKKPHNQCILNLVIVDILTAISLFVSPKFVLEPDAYSVPAGSLAREIYCRFIWSHFIPFSLGITSVYTCLAIAIERWFVVVRHVNYRNENGTRIMKFVIPLCWLTGFLLEGLIIPRVIGVEGTNETSSCNWTDEKTNKAMVRTLGIALFMGEIFLPVCGMVFAYVHVFISLRAKVRFVSSLKSRGNSATVRANSSRNIDKIILKRVTIMIGFASLTLILGWLPNQIHLLFALLGFWNLQDSMPVILVLGAVGFLNACINPIIYVLMDRRFRKGFQELFYHCSSTH